MIERESQFREYIEDTVAAWFGGPIHVSERVLQLLSAAKHCDDGWMDDAEILTEAARVQPAITNLLIRSGLEETSVATLFAEMNGRSTLKLECDVDPNIEITLSYALRKNTKQFRIVRKERRLTVTDLIIGNLRTSLDGETPTVTCQIIEAAGLASDYWTPQNRKYVSDLIKRWETLELLDVNLDDQQFVMYWDGKRYRFRPFGSLGLYHLADEFTKRGPLWIARGNVIQPCTRFTEESFEELEDLINSSSAERDFQTFFERHPEFLLALGGGMYIDLHPQIAIRQDDGSRLIPDFFLESINNHLCDICDLKLATETIRKHNKNRPGFRAAVFEAVAQLEYYRNWFEDKAHREEFYQRTGLQAYRPRVIVVIGRSLDYYSDIERIQREAILPSHIDLLTYDDISRRARTYVKIAGGRVNSA